MSIEQTYAGRMRRETGFFAAWPPNAPIAIGDFGPVEGQVFQTYGQLEPAEIRALAVREGPSPAHFDILADAKWSVSTGAKASADVRPAKGKAVLQVGFSADDGFSFTASDAAVRQATDLMALGRLLNARRLEGAWDLDHSVVVEVTATRSTTVLISNKAGGGLGFEVAAETPLSSGTLAGLGSKTSVLWSEGVRTRIIGEGPLTPLFRLAQLRKRMFKGPKLVHRGAPSALSATPPTSIEVDEDHVLALS